MRIVNGSQFFGKLQKRLKEIPERNSKRACLNSANLVRNTAIQSIARGAATGETYVKYNPRRTHTASAPGQPPASDTGFLISSISSSVEKHRGSVVGVVRASSPYAAHLEFGTQQMAARPFFQPALDRNATKIKAIFQREGLIK